MDTTTTERRQLVNAWVEPEDVERLDLLAREADRSRSAELRLAIREHLKRERYDETQEEA